ncbi:MAG: hypothetical protein ACRDVN_15775 [Jiangellaceae bacterium]
MTDRDHESDANGYRRSRVAGMTLRASWLRRTLDARRPEPTDRPTPGVDGVVSALLGPDRSVHALERALRALAWERASDSLGLDAVLEEVDSLWAVLQSGGLAPVTRRQARAWLVDGWVDALAADRGAPCIDPLSGLPTTAYLIARIDELDRLVREPVPLVLLAVQWAEPSNPWARLATVLAAARTVRARVRPEATLGQDGTRTVLALVLDDARARLERTALARSCTEATLAEAGATVDLVPVPERRVLVPGVVRRLHRSAPRAQCSAGHEECPNGCGREDPSRAVD